MPNHLRLRFPFRTATDHPRTIVIHSSMRFDELPEELLLQIAGLLHPDASTPIGACNDLLQFCLVSRTLSRIGQEVLFKSPNLQSCEHAEQKVIKLLVALLHRPDLGNHVQSLRLDFMENWYRHDCRKRIFHCAPYCTIANDDCPDCAMTLNLCFKFLETLDLFEDVPIFNFR